MMSNPTPPINEVLEVCVTANGQLKITIGLNALKTAIELDPYYYAQTFRITNFDEVVAAMVNELTYEDEVGATAVHRLLDQAYRDAVENGCEGVEEVITEDDE